MPPSLDMTERTDYFTSGPQTIITHGCSSNPCFPDVMCFDEPDGLGYRCGPCPAGYRGNGSYCYDINEASPSHLSAVSSRDRLYNIKGPNKSYNFPIWSWSGRESYISVKPQSQLQTNRLAIKDMVTFV